MCRTVTTLVLQIDLTETATCIFQLIEINYMYMYGLRFDWPNDLKVIILSGHFFFFDRCGHAMCRLAFEVATLLCTNVATLPFFDKSATNNNYSLTGFIHVTNKLCVHK